MALLSAVAVFKDLVPGIGWAFGVSFRTLVHVRAPLFFWGWMFHRFRERSGWQKSRNTRCRDWHRQ